MVTQLHSESLEQLQARVAKVEWMLEQGKQAMAINANDMELLHSHRCMTLHHQKLVAQLNTAYAGVREEAHAA